MDVTMKKVVEASYLTADSAAHYRTILRYFYHQHERMRDFISPEEILEHMHTIPSFSDYQEEQLHQQLAQLVKWNNLIARQDMTNAKTVEEYKKKRFRYQSTPYTIEIERMLTRIESYIAIEELYRPNGSCDGGKVSDIALSAKSKAELGKSVHKQ